MQKEQIEHLNSILKGEYMAIDTYKNFMDKIDDENLSEKLAKIIHDHEIHAFAISSQIRQLGGEPKEGSGMNGLIFNTINTIKIIGVTDKADILKQLYEGEEKGIAAALEIAKDHLDEENRALVEEMMSEDEQHLSELSELITQYKNLH